MLIQRKVIRGFSTVTMVTKPSHIVTMVYPEFDSRFLLFFHSKCVPLPGNPLISRLPSLSRIVYIVSLWKQPPVAEMYSVTVLKFRSMLVAMYLVRTISRPYSPALRPPT